MRSPVVVPAVAWVIGVAVGVCTATMPARPGRDLVAVTVAGAIAARRLPRRVRTCALAGAVCLAGMGHGADARDAALETSLRRVLDASVGHFLIESVGVGGAHEPVWLRAVLAADASDGGDYLSIRAEADALHVNGQWQHVSGPIVLTVNGASGRDRLREWRAGRAIEVPVTFRRPSRFLNAGVPDFERDAALGGITLFASAKSGLLVEVVRHGTSIQEAAADVRAFVRASVARWVAPHGTLPAAIVTAILIGDRTGLPDEIRERLQAAGTYHVIAISGGNIAILAGVIVTALTLARVPSRLTALAAIVILAAYAQVAAAGPSVWRATLMAVLFFGARVFDHRTPPWHAMAVAAAVITLLRPLDVRDAGFLLTFGATSGLLGAARIAGAPRLHHRAARWLVASMVASLAAEIVVLPVSASVFSRMTAAGLLLNLVAVPAMAVVQVAGMLVVVCARIGVQGSAAGWIAAQGATALVESSRLVDVLPVLVRRVPPPPLWIVAVYYGALCAAGWCGSRFIRLLGIAACGLTGLVMAIGLTPVVGVDRDRNLRLTVFDVGQGDSILLQVPGVDPLLVDAGGSPFGGGAFDIGGRVVTPALWARGVRRLEALLVTHGDPDHLGGAESVIRDLRPGSLWWGVPVPPHLPSRGVLEAAGHAGIAVDPRRGGQAIAYGRARVRVLNPPEPEWERQRVRNDDSVVLEIVYGDVALLLTGDISADVERIIAPQLTPVRTRILKVAHHGSRTSSSSRLLEVWHPQIALISCGRGNTFGHPAPEVIARLEAVGARIYRTDRDGEITLETDGRGVTVRTFTGTGR